MVGAGGVLGRKLHVGAERLGQADRIARLLQALLPRDLELVLQMNVGSGKKHVDARPGRSLQRLPGPLDVRRAGPRQAGNDGPPNGRGNGLHRGKVAFRGDGEAGLDDVHAQPVELVRQAQLFLHVHAAPGRLLAVAQGRVEYRDPCSFHAEALLHGTSLMLRGMRCQEKLIIIKLVLDILT